MGPRPYWYIVEYKPDVNAALQELRQREFQAGRYNPVIHFPKFPLGPNPPAPGARHATFAEAFEDADADVTRSIIDLEYISEEPEVVAVSPLKDEQLINLFGTTRPTMQTVDTNRVVWQHLERMQGIYTVLYEDERPNAIYLAGYSAD